MHQLVRKSIVVVDEVGGPGPTTTRYHFLETIRQYAEEKLFSAGEGEAARDRHCDWYVRLAEEAEHGMEGSDQRHWWNRLELELDNLRAALTWTAARPNGDTQLPHLAGLLGRFWRARDHLQEGGVWLEAALSHLQPTTPPSADHARVLHWLAMVQMYHGHIQAAKSLYEQSAAQARAVGDSRLLSVALRHLGIACLSSGEYGLAHQLLEEALEVSREAGPEREIAWNLAALAESQIREGREASGARRLLEESIAVGRESGDLTPVVYSMTVLGQSYAAQGDTRRAREVIEDGLSHAAQLAWMARDLLVLLGDLETRERNWDTAADLYCRALQLASASATRTAITHTVRHYAAMLGARGKHRRALRLLGATAMIDQGVYRALAVGEEAVFVKATSAARSALGERGFAEAWAEGEAMTLAQATAEMLDETRLVRSD